MKYKTVYQLRWLAVLWLIFLIYLSNFILIKLPFISVNFPKKDLEHGILSFLHSFFPTFQYEMNIYNLQTIVVWISGIILGPKIGALSVGAYLLLGLIGLPIFAGGGGIDYYNEPTFGYLISLPLHAYLSGWLYEQNKKLFSVVVPIFLTHLMGVAYILLFKQGWITISWNLSFSMISYDLFFAFLLLPVMPGITFFLKEIFMQEIPSRESITATPAERYKKMSRRMRRP